MNCDFRPWHQDRSGRRFLFSSAPLSDSLGLLLFVERYNLGYTRNMKTAISIPDEVYEAADELARRLGMSRSKLYATAVAEFVAEYRTTAVRERLDQVYGDAASELDDSVHEMQLASLPEDEW